MTLHQAVLRRLLLGSRLELPPPPPKPRPPQRLQPLIDAASRLVPPDVLAVAEPIKDSIEVAIALILEEHQDWQMLVRPHLLPLG